MIDCQSTSKESLCLLEVKIKRKYGHVCYKKHMLSYTQAMVILFRGNVIEYLLNLLEVFQLKYWFKLILLIPMVFGKRLSMLKPITIS